VSDETQAEQETVIEVVCTKTKEVVRTIDITKHSDRNADKIRSGLERNLNHIEYHTRVVTRVKESREP